MLRAFGPPGCAAPWSAGAEHLARRVGLSARIAARTPAHQLNGELGEEPARQLALLLLQTRGTNRLLAGAAAHVELTAEQLGVPIMWLKHAALLRAGVVREGEREARDVDVLTTVRHAPRLHAGLQLHGFRSVGGARSDYHLTPLVNAAGACIEIHYAVRGLEMEGHAGEAVTEHLLGLGSSTPPREVLAAHAIVHGLVQHLVSPEASPPLRTLADVIDLRVWELPVDELHRYIAGSVGRTLISALQHLAELLARGGTLEELANTPEAYDLLAHCLAASRDDAYRAALRLHRVFELREQGGLLRGLGRLVRGPSLPPSDRSLVAGSSFSERLDQAGQLLLGAVTFVRLRRRALRRQSR